MPPINPKDFDISTITGLTQDSRAVEEGYLFAAIAGEKADGRDFIDAAIEKGARAILTHTGTDISIPENITILHSDNPRRDLALLSSRFYAHQPKIQVAIGGTNGKSSSVHFLRQLWESKGYKAASIGTLGLEGEVQTRLDGASMTTPDPVSLHRALASLAQEGADHIAIESSSHGLDQHRLDGMDIRIGAFTSFSRDHMDYHGDEQSYLNAKLRQFSHLMPRGSTAILNADIPQFEILEQTCRNAGHRILSYGKNGQDLTLISAQPKSNAQELHLRIMGNEYHITLPLVGHFQVMNALCALGCAIAENPEDTSATEHYINALSFLRPVPGRLQRIGDTPEKVIYVDYAHTPDALENVLNALRPHTHNKLYCLFGCGGDRDNGKRPIMGEIAARLADEVIITDDNPRSEDPSRIRAQIMSGASTASQSVQEIENRRAAILYAVAQIGSGDVLVVAGKGHEQGQIFKTHTEPFDDADEIEKALKHVTTTKTPPQQSLSTNT